MQADRTATVARTVVFLAVCQALVAPALSLGQIDWSRPSPALVPASELENGYWNPHPCLIGNGWFDVLVLSRSPCDSQEILFSGSMANPVQDVRDMELGALTALRAGFLLGSPCGCDLQFNYLGVLEGEETATRSDPNLFYWFYWGVPATPAAAYTVVYRSQLHSEELNIRTRQWQRLAPLAGFRALQLEEDLDVVDATNTSTGVFSNVRNHMYGVQFGGQALLCQWGCSRLETVVKAGVLMNDVALSAQASSVTGSPYNLSRDFYHTAFCGEFQLSWVYVLGPYMQAKLGYQALFLDGVALAPDQNDDFSVTTGEGFLDLGSSIYQGGYVGFEITW